MQVQRIQDYLHMPRVRLNSCESVCIVDQTIQQNHISHIVCTRPKHTSILDFVSLFNACLQPEKVIFKSQSRDVIAVDGNLDVVQRVDEQYRTCNAWCEPASPEKVRDLILPA